jgi:hypothetical protein
MKQSIELGAVRIGAAIQISRHRIVPCDAPLETEHTS